MAGWFKIQRDINDHWIWKSNEPFDRRSAWIDLIMLANYADRKATDGESVVLRRRGDVNYSMLFLARRWKWDRRKVKRFLVALESDGMVSLHGTSHGTTITIENYAKHQDIGTTDGTYDGTADVQRMVQPMYTIEERKEIKEIKEINNKRSGGKRIADMTREEKDVFLQAAHERFAQIGDA